MTNPTRRPTRRPTRPTRPGLVVLVLTLLATVGLAPLTARADDPSLRWVERPTGSTERFRGLSVVNRQVAWVSGTTGTVLRTRDGGSTWSDVSPGIVDGFDTSTLQFRDIEAWEGGRAVILSIGTGAESRIYRTDDGGRSWTTSFVNAEEVAFYDCLAFWDARNGLALSDPVDGKFRLQRTTDNGRTWSQVDPSGMPPALEGEFAFAASGTCLVTAGAQYAWIATGGADPARVLRSSDRGLTWTAAATPLRAGPTAGVYSLAFRNPRDGVAVGGAFDAETDGSDAAAWSDDGGQTWTASTDGVGGYRSGSAWLRRDHGVVAVGPTGSDVSWDGGRTWTVFDTGSFDSVECNSNGACWASGAEGRVALLARTR